MTRPTRDSDALCRILPWDSDFFGFTVARAVARAGLLGRPRRRRDAEADHEPEVQADEREDGAGQQQHVDGVEPAERVHPDVGAPAPMDAAPASLVK